MATTNITRNQVTEDMLSKCHRIVDGNGEVFYQVESRTEAGKEYEVRYNRELKAIICNCKASEEGTTCWHKRAAVGHAQAYKAEQKAIAEYEARTARVHRLMEMGLTLEEATEALSHQLLVDGKEADDETLVRVYGPRHRRPSEKEIEQDYRHYQTRPFSLLKK